MVRVMIHSRGGNLYDKYNTLNPMFRLLMKNFLEIVSRVISDDRPARILEIGCGEGYLARELFKRKSIQRYTGIDLDPDVITLARDNCKRGVFAVGSAYDLREYSGVEYDYAILAEVLEHIQEPAAALSQIRQLHADTFIFTVPNEPLWRFLNVLRFRYLRDMGNTPGHLQHWNRKSFGSLLSQFFEVKEVRTAFPWIIAICK